jgi:hypothetical protein
MENWTVLVKGHFALFHRFLQALADFAGDTTRTTVKNFAGPENCMLWLKSGDFDADSETE